MAKELSKKVKRDSRNAIGAERFVKQLKQDYNFKIDEKGYAYALKLVNMDAFENHTWYMPERYQNRTVATFANQKVTISDVLPFWVQNQQAEVGGKWRRISSLAIQHLCNDKVVAYEDSQLESKYTDFRNLVREYREGILLFDLTQDEVWDKAAKDSAGIALEYERIKESYRWDDRITYNYWVCKEAKDARRIAKWLLKDRRDKVDELLESQEASEYFFMLQGWHSRKTSLCCKNLEHGSRCLWSNRTRLEDMLFCWLKPVTLLLRKH